MSPADPGENPQTRIEREEFAKGHVPRGTPPVEPRAAATIAVARPADPGFEVLLLERPQASRFAAGAFVFPGGVVDDEDASPVWANRLPPVPETAACAAALRELFEETGILIGEVRRQLDPAEISRHRRALLADEALFVDLVEALDLDLRASSLVYLARWITPRSLARRYDTRFFLAPVPAGTRVDLTPEHDSARWEPAGRALELVRTGELPMLFPTRKTLEGLAGFEALGDAVAGLGARAVHPILAKLSMRGDTLRPLMPGDPGYDDAY